MTNHLERIALARVVITALMMHNDKSQRYSYVEDLRDAVKRCAKTDVFFAALLDMMKRSEITLDANSSAIELAYAESSVKLFKLEEEHEDDRKHVITETYHEHLSALVDQVEEQREALTTILADIDTRYAEVEEQEYKSDLLNALEKLRNAARDAFFELKQAQTTLRNAATLALDTIEDNA